MLTNKIKPHHEVYFRPRDEKNESLLIRAFFEKNIKYRSVYSVKGDVYITSEADKDCLENLSVELEVINVQNIGALSPKERREIKKYDREQREKRKKITFVELKNMLGELKEQY